MYNRYIRNDQGGYSRIPVEDGPSRQAPPSSPQSPGGGSPSPGHAQPPPNASAQSNPPPHGPPPPPNGGSSPFWGERKDDGRTGGISGFLRRILDKFHLESVDTGDVLLLLILFFLFKEDADDELLIALGLLLIL